MGEGSFGLLYALIIFAPYIAIGVFCLIGLVLLFRKAGASRIVGCGMLVAAAFGVFGVPVLNSIQQDRTTNRFLAEALLPDAIKMQDAKVLLIGSQSPECALMCAVMIEGGYASEIFEGYIEQGPAEEIYRSGPFDLTSLSGYVQDANGRPLVARQVTDQVEFVLFNETHWLAYHDAQSFLQFPEDAYSGIFLFRVTDARAFDIAEAELVMRIYQSEQMPNRFLWFSDTTNDRSLPSNVKIAKIFTEALANGASSETAQH